MKTTECQQKINKETNILTRAKIHVVCLWEHKNMKKCFYFFPTYLQLPSLFPSPYINKETKVHVFFAHQEVPSLVVLLYILLCVTTVFPMILLAQVLSGTLIGWVYLRFYQPHGKGIKGDLSENFCFASFFPDVMQ